jgi:hypothetical protein
LRSEARASVRVVTARHACGVERHVAICVTPHHELVHAP